jgi:hypothetical protein
MLHCSAKDMSSFWELATSSLLLILSHLKEDPVPKDVFRKGIGIDSIEKYLWIIHEKFNFATTSKLKLNRFHS